MKSRSSGPPFLSEVYFFEYLFLQNGTIYFFRVEIYISSEWKYIFLQNGNIYFFGMEIQGFLAAGTRVEGLQVTSRSGGPPFYQMSHTELFTSHKICFFFENIPESLHLQETRTQASSQSYARVNSIAGSLFAIGEQGDGNAIYARVKQWPEKVKFVKFSMVNVELIWNFYVRYGLQYVSILLRSNVVKIIYKFTNVSVEIFVVCMCICNL